MWSGESNWTMSFVWVCPNLLCSWWDWWSCCWFNCCCSCNFICCCCWWYCCLWRFRWWKGFCANWSGESEFSILLLTCKLAVLGETVPAVDLLFTMYRTFFRTAVLLLVFLYKRLGSSCNFWRKIYKNKLKLSKPLKLYSNLFQLTSQFKTKCKCHKVQLIRLKN